MFAREITERRSPSLRSLRGWHLGVILIGALLTVPLVSTAAERTAKKPVASVLSLEPTSRSPSPSRSTCEPFCAPRAVQGLMGKVCNVPLAAPPLMLVLSTEPSTI